MPTRRLAALTVVIPVVAACMDAEGAGWAGTVSDSAGVQVVQNPAEGMWEPEDAWTVVEELSIGSMDASAEYQFGQIVGVDVDADGNVYVADGQAQDVRVFDTEGRHVRTIGRPGSGPGELGIAMNGVFSVGEEIVVPDLGNARVQRFSTVGEPLGSERIELTAGVPLRWDLAGGGRVVVQRRVVNLADTAAAPMGDPIVTLGVGGAPVDTVAMLPMGQSIQFRGGQAQVRFFDPEPIWDADPEGHILTGRNDAMRFELWDQGTLVRVMTLPHEPKPLTDRDKRVMLDAISDAARAQGAPPQAVEAFLARAQFADNYPAFASVALGPAGSMWVQRLRTGNELVGDEEATFDIQDLGSNDWDVFDGAGRYLGVVSFPGKYQPIRAMGDRFYGIARDEMDVQSLKVYRVVTTG